MSSFVYQERLPYTPEVARRTSDLYEKVKAVVPAVEWPVLAPLIADINRLKKEKNAIILAHNYQTPEIFHCISDIVGDSLHLAREAARTDADIIVQCGVHFMAETSKLLSPEKTVLIPDPEAGCSLAASITAQDVKHLKERYPGVPVVTYVNTSADVKAESDICCTSSNAVHIVESLGAPRVLCIPDEYLAQNIAEETSVEILTWQGRCEVHEQFTAEEIRDYKDAHPGLAVVAHPECKPDVIAESDFSGSTSAMIRWVREHQPSQVFMVTECSMSDNVAVENPEVDFVRPCNLCPHMKKITLEKIHRALLTGQHEVTIEPAVAVRARKPVERMLAVSSVPPVPSVYDRTRHP